MKLFRLRFILLGLLLCIFHVWCRTCGTDFTDPESKAILADVVLEGKLSQKLQTPELLNRYNFTVKVRKILKGREILTKSKRNPKYLKIGDFGPVLNEESCVSNITRDDKKYYFFLKSTDQSDYLLLSSFPEKVSRRIGRKIRKILTCKNCVKAPKIKRIKGKKSVKEGKTIQLRCQLGPSKPQPKIYWEKDGVILKKGKGIQIKSGRKGSRLRLKKSKSTDSGNYVCVAKNAVSTDRMAVNIKILPKSPVDSTLAPVTPSTSRFKKCPPEDDTYCLNHGECRIIVLLNYRMCNCQKNFRGTRCEERTPVLPSSMEDYGRSSLEKDRTLTIIGIVIGLLLFICICIASYFLAKRRRDRFYRRQEEKRQKLSTQVSNIPISPPPPHYIKLPSVDAELGNSFSKQKPFERCYKNSETQTDEPDYEVPINPNVNMNLYHNPLDNNNILLRNSPTSDKNSRSRLSGTSAGKRNSDTQPRRGSGHEGRPLSKPGVLVHLSSRGDNSNQHLDKKPRLSSGRDDKAPARRSSSQEPNNKRNSIPKIRHVSDIDVNSDDENVEALTPLYISEDDIRGKKDKKLSNNSPPLVMKDSSSSYSSDGSVTSSVENLRHLNNVRDGGMSWNERGSPEPVEFNDNHFKRYRGHYLNNDNMQYPKSLQNNDRKKRHVSDSKSIPV